MNSKIYENINVLVIDDSEEVSTFISVILKEENMDVVVALTAEDGLEQLNKDINVIILDLMLPCMSGKDFLISMRQNKEFSDIQVIVLTAAENNDEEIATLFELGADDYILKPFFRAEFVSRIRNHAKLNIFSKEIKRNNQRLRKQILMYKKAIKNEELLNKKILDDSFKLKKAYERIEKLNNKLRHTSTHDNLTKIYNRAAIMEFLENDIKRTKRIKTSLGLVMFDLDFFKLVNDTYGHLVGDEVLRNVAHLIQKNIRGIDLLGRYGGEEFLLILPDTTLTEGINLCERLIEKINSNIIVTSKGELKQTISMGITVYNENETIDCFIERVDSALYQSKKTGRNKYTAI